MAETQLCELRGAQTRSLDVLNLHFIYNMVLVNWTYDMVANTQFHQFAEGLLQRGWLCRKHPTRTRIDFTNTWQIHSSNRYYSSTGKYLPHRFLVGVFVHIRNTCPVCCRGYSSKGRIIFAPCLERVFIQGTDICPMCWRGCWSMGRIVAPCFGEDIRPTNEYSPRDLEKVFIHGRILASCRGEGIRQKPTNSLIYALRILWGRINDIIYTRNSPLVR